MKVEFLNQAHGQLVTQARTNLRHRIQQFVVSTKEDPNGERLPIHASVVEDATNFLHAVSLTKRFDWRQDGQNQVVTGRIQTDTLTLSASDKGENRAYSALVNGVDVSAACARELWNRYGVPTRRRHVTAKLLKSRE